MVSSQEECQNITNALSNLGFKNGQDFYGNGVWSLNALYNLLAPFGCLYTDNPTDGVYWSEPINIQSSLPCGVKNQGKEYFCFCKKRSKV